MRPARPAKRARGRSDTSVTAAQRVAADAVWSVDGFWVVFIVGVCGVLAFGFVSVLVDLLRGLPGPPVFFLGLMFAALGWNLYWWLFRLATRVELVGDVLRWRAPFGRGEIPVAAVESVGRFFRAPWTCALRAPGHRRMVVFTQTQSFEPMLAALNRLNPAIPVDAP